MKEHKESETAQTARCSTWFLEKHLHPVGGQTGQFSEGLQRKVPSSVNDMQNGRSMKSNQAYPV